MNHSSWTTPPIRLPQLHTSTSPATYLNLWTKWSLLALLSVSAKNNLTEVHVNSNATKAPMLELVSSGGVEEYLISLLFKDKIRFKIVRVTGFQVIDEIFPECSTSWLDHLGTEVEGIDLEDEGKGQEVVKLGESLNNMGTPPRWPLRLDGQWERSWNSYAQVQMGWRHSRPQVTALVELIRTSHSLSGRWGKGITHCPRSLYVDWSWQKTTVLMYLWYINKFISIAFTDICSTHSILYYIS